MKNLELLHFEQLKTEIEAQFLKRHTPSQDEISQWKGFDIVYFQEDLREITKGTISEKSFYTYFKAKNLEKTPRIDMLNILSQYVGYASWYEFKKKHLFDNEILQKETQENSPQPVTISSSLSKEIPTEELHPATAGKENPISENKMEELAEETLHSEKFPDTYQEENVPSKQSETSLERKFELENNKVVSPTNEIISATSKNDLLLSGTVSNPSEKESILSENDSLESKWVPSTPSQEPFHPSPALSEGTSGTFERPLNINEGVSGTADDALGIPDRPADEAAKEGFLSTENPPKPTGRFSTKKIIPKDSLPPRSKKWLWWGLGLMILALVGLGVYLVMPKKYAYVFRDADRGTNVQVSVLVKVNKPGESPLYFRLRPGEPFVYETREHSLNMEVSSPLYENISLTRNLDNAPDTEYILLRPDDYKSAVYYYSKKNIAPDSDHAVEQLTEKRRELNRRISDDAQIYQVFDNDIYGIESLTKDQYITLVTTPTTSLRNLSFIDVKSKNGKIISIKFKINENEKHP